MKKYIKFKHKIRNRFNSTVDFYEFQRFQAQWILNNLTKFDLCDRIVLDLGSEKWYTTELVKKCIFVCGFDIHTRFLPINNVKIPLLSEFLTWYGEFLLQKRGDYY